jgi:hypothetical protein
MGFGISVMRRYGKVEPSLLRSLLSVRQQRAITSSLAQRMGVLAWDDLAGETEDVQSLPL